MDTDQLVRMIDQLTGMIAILSYVTLLGGRPHQEGEACDLLVEARRKLMEELDEMRTQQLESE